MNWSDYPKEMQRKAEMSQRMIDLADRGRAVTYGMKRAVVARLLRAWDAAPALRFGQLILAACERDSLFAVEDERLVALAEAMTVVPEVETLTDSEKAIAVMLDAWKRWPGVALPRTAACGALVGVTLVLEEHGLTIGDDTTEEGDVLLARARKAGVL